MLSATRIHKICCLQEQTAHFTFLQHLPQTNTLIMTYTINYNK